MKLGTLGFRPVRRAIPEPVACPVIDLRPGGADPPSARWGPPLTVSVHWLGRTVVLAVAGELDMSTAPELSQAISLALGKNPRRLVIDLALVRFMACAGLTALLDGHRQAFPGTDLRVVANTRATWRPLQITRLRETLAIHSSRAEAVAAPRTQRRHSGHERPGTTSFTVHSGPADR